MKTQIFDRICAVFRQTFKLYAGAPTRETGRDQVADWDSLNHLHFILGLEREFKVRIRARDAVGMTRLAETERVLRALMVEQAGTHEDQL